MKHIKATAFLTLYLFTAIPSTCFADWDGTANFINDDGYLITAYHVIQQSTRRGVVVLFSGANLPFKVVDIWPNEDLALLKVTGKTPNFLKLSNDILKAGDHIKSTGYPNGKLRSAPTVYPVVCDGCEKNYKHSDKWAKRIGMIYYGRGTSIEGMSGGAYLDKNNNLIAIVSGGNTKHKTCDFIGIEQIIQFLNRAGVEYTLSNSYSPINYSAIKLVDAYVK